MLLAGFITDATSSVEIPPGIILATPRRSAHDIPDLARRDVALDDAA
jgi:hypothetical protein